MIEIQKDGSVTGLIKVRPVTHPKNVRCEDYLCNQETLTKQEANLIANWCDRKIKENEENTT